jgi:hypothetical protein
VCFFVFFLQFYKLYLHFAAGGSARCIDVAGPLQYEMLALAFRRGCGRRTRIRIMSQTIFFAAIATTAAVPVSSPRLDPAPSSSPAKYIASL